MDLDGLRRICICISKDLNMIDVAGFRCIWTDSEGSGRISMDFNECERIRTELGGFGWIRMDLDGFGRI